MLYDSVKRMVPPDFTHLPPLTDLYIKFAPGVSKTQALAHIRTVSGKDYDIVLPTRPGDLVNFGQVQNLPLLLAGLIAVLAAATLAHTLVTSIRRRRRDLAILKMLGFVPSQVRWAVAWQATTFISVALLIGLPIGIAVGRLVWTAFAQGLGTVAEPVTPWVLKLLLTIPGTIILANLIAAIPAVIAGRMKPAPALRAE
jgi:ABC-type antimicrobial peptide transport system permease subunit